MARGRRIAAVLAIGAAGVALSRHLRGMAGTPARGGILISSPSIYDALMGWAFGSFYDRVANDIAASVPVGARVLEVGCGPGHLARRLAARGLDVAGLDLDSAMIKRAREGSGAEAIAVRAAAASEGQAAGRPPEYVVGDVADLPFATASFDAVVSTLSVHHWADVDGGMREVVRVLAPGGRALIWDLMPGRMPLHPGLPKPSQRLAEAGVRVDRAESWRWPGPFHLTERVEIGGRSH